MVEQEIQEQLLLLQKVEVLEVVVLELTMHLELAQGELLEKEHLVVMVHLVVEI